MTPRSPRYWTLDHWRGIACLMVVVFHSTSVYAYSPHVTPSDALAGFSDLVLAATRLLWAGVPIFFVISGYAISATVDGSRMRGEGPRPYMRRRIRRIYPPYWAMLGLQVALVFAIDVVISPGLLTTSVAPIERPWEFTGVQWLGNATLTESWRYHVLNLGSERDYILGQAWTLCYEEQFYLVAGAILLLAARRYFLAALVVTGFTLVAPPIAGALGVSIDGFFFDGNWLMFAAGILVYWQVNYGPRRAQRLSYAALALGGLYALRSAPNLSQLDENLLVAVAFAAALLALHPLDDRLAESGRLRPIRFAGTICFSLYLSHAVIVRSLSQAMANVGLDGPSATLFIVVPLCTASALLVGWAFHLAVERRFLSRRSGRERGGTPAPALSGFAGAVVETAPAVAVDPSPRR